MDPQWLLDRMIKTALRVVPPTSGSIPDTLNKHLDTFRIEALSAASCRQTLSVHNCHPRSYQLMRRLYLLITPPSVFRFDDTFPPGRLLSLLTIASRIAHELSPV